jgi:hypothetical protein
MKSGSERERLVELTHVAHFDHQRLRQPARTMRCTAAVIEPARSMWLFLTRNMS